MNGGLNIIGGGNEAAAPAGTAVPAQSTPVVPAGHAQYASVGPLCRHWPPPAQLMSPMMLPVLQTASEILMFYIQFS